MLKIERNGSWTTGLSNRFRPLRFHSWPRSCRIPPLRYRETLSRRLDSSICSNMPGPGRRRNALDPESDLPSDFGRSRLGATSAELLPRDAGVRAADFNRERSGVDCAICDQVCLLDLLPEAR
jgi:hypothetical protein